MESINETPENQVEKSEEKQLIVSEEIKTDLRKTAGWTTFFAILGFIGSGFLILAGVFMFFLMGIIGSLDEMQQNQEIPFQMMKYIGLVYILIGVAIIFPYMHLYKFSEMVKRSFYKNEQELFAGGINRLFKYYRFMGIFTISIFILYFVFLAVFLVVGLSNIPL